MIAHIAIFTNETDASTFADDLDTLLVPGAFRYGNRVQVPVPSTSFEEEHREALASFARTVTDRFQIARVAE